MKCKICGTNSFESLSIAIEAGADAIGFIVGITHTSEDALSPALARQLIHALPPFVSGVVVTHLTGEKELIHLVEETECSVLQIQDMASIETIQTLRKKFPYLHIIKAVHVMDRTSIETARIFADVADSLILDSRTADRLGGTGLTHDWSISAEIVQSVDVPVILAGGLKPENLDEAIQTVKPYAVDVHSGVKAGGVRDVWRTEEFVRIAHQY